jgi:hypothetical protein
VVLLQLLPRIEVRGLREFGPDGRVEMGMLEVVMGMKALLLA